MGGGRVELAYAEDFEEGTGSILCANKELVEYLTHNEEIVVEGRHGVSEVRRTISSCSI